MPRLSKLRLVGQRRAVLRHLLSHATLTNREALLELGVGRLASRIDELRRLGVEIVSERPVKGKRFVAYRLTNPHAAKALLGKEAGA